MIRMKGVEQYIKLAIVIAIVCVFGVFAYRYFSVSGTMVVSYDFSTDEHPIVEHFLPKGRAKEPEKNIVSGNTYQRITGDPVYMNLTVPRSFETVDVVVNYKNPDLQFAQFGVVLNENPYAIRLAPFEVPVIDEALRDWHTTTADDGTVLLQRNQQFSSVAEFVDAVPTDAAVGTYQYDLPVHYTDSQYEDLDQIHLYNRRLRGSHTFVTYIGNEALEVAFELVDQNLSAGEDTVRLQIMDANGTIVHEDLLEDDGITDDSGQNGNIESLQVRAHALAEGVYTIKVITTEDVLINSIRTVQNYFVVKDLILLDDPDNSPLTLFTEAQDMRFVSSTLDGLQDVRIVSDRKESTVSVGEVHTPYVWIDSEVGGHVRHVTLQQDNMRIWTRGYFAFSQEQYFDPDYRVGPITEFTELEDLDYIIYSNYTSPDHKRLESTQAVSLSLDGMAGDRKELQFVLSMPGIDESGAEVTIHDVEFTFKREPFFTRLKDRLWKRN